VAPLKGRANRPVGGSRPKRRPAEKHANLRPAWDGPVPPGDPDSLRFDVVVVKGRPLPDLHACPDCQRIFRDQLALAEHVHARH
jgi:hypothetical protein